MYSGVEQGLDPAPGPSSKGLKDGVTQPGTLLIDFLLLFAVADICYTLHWSGCPLRHLPITAAAFLSENVLIKTS